MSKKKLTQKKLKELLYYDPETGIFTWNKYMQSNAKFGCKAGGLSSQGYNRISILGERYISSRLAHLYMEGYFPENEMDHINRVRHDDRWVNLRAVTHMCNLRNVGIKSNNTSGITGVCFDKKNSKWLSYIILFGKFNNLGRYKNKIDAANRRWESEKENGFPNCQTTSSSFSYLKERGLI